MRKSILLEIKENEISKLRLYKNKNKYIIEESYFGEDWEYLDSFSDIKTAKNLIKDILKESRRG